MEAIDFIKKIRERVIENDFSDYQNYLENTINAKDPYWVEAIVLYKSFTEDQKKAFLKFIRLVQVNTLSHVFGILDGSTFLSNERETFKLTSESSKESLSGDLQNIFLEMEENM